MNQTEQVYTYKDLVKRLYDLESLAVPPQAGEKSGCFQALTGAPFIMPRQAYTRIGELMMTVEASFVRKETASSPWNWMVPASSGDSGPRFPRMDISGFILIMPIPRDRSALPGLF